MDADPRELPKTEARLRELGFGPEVLTTVRSNFAGLPQILASVQLERVDAMFADLGVSSMQLDDPTRGFSTKRDGPLDMRMNPGRGQTASALLARLKAPELATLLQENADEPHASKLAEALAGRELQTTAALSQAIRKALPRVGSQELEAATRRVFQVLRIGINDEFSALETFLRNLPFCLNPGGRVAVLTFHSGEDRRVKKAFASGLREGVYAEISPEVIRASPEERFSNPRSSPAKLRWARVP